MSTSTFLYKGDAERGRRWGAVFARERPDIAFRLWPDMGDADDVCWLAAWEPPADFARLFPGLQAVFSTGAGVDQFDLSQLPPALPLVRMIEPGIERGMTEYVVHAVLDLHRDMPAYRRQQQAAQWQPLPVKTADQRRVGVLGTGNLGQAAMRALAQLGFEVEGWSRSAAVKTGRSLPEFLGRSEILVCLLPLTDETRGFLDASRLALLPRGAGLVHVGRGPQLVAADLLAALDAGQLSEAVLDVTDPEPLPATHALWRHPRVRLTPHIASMTQPESAARAVLDNLRRLERGEAPLGLVDRTRGF